MGWRRRRNSVLGVAVDKVLCQQGLSIHSHLAAVEALEIVILQRIRVVRFSVAVCLPGIAGRRGPRIDRLA